MPSRYNSRGAAPTMEEPTSRYYRRHGKYSELEFRTGARKAERDRKRANNPRLVYWHFLHHDL